jgi:AcrR family transcriptional regulator
MALKSGTLLKRKQQVVRDAIWDAAIELFAKKGFDQVTVDEIAEAAGVSPRSFFRYFASKNDLMGQAVLQYGRSIGEAIEACPKSSRPIEVMKKVTLEIAEGVAAQPRTRQVIRICEKSAAAKEALAGSIVTIEDRVAEAFQSRSRKGSKDTLTPRLLAALTLSILQVVNKCWAESESADISAIVERAFFVLSQLAGK